jgi:hypothetical protein
MTKKPTIRIEEQAPRNIRRVDIVPESGFALVVDGRLKTQFSDEGTANKAASELLAKFPMLGLEIYSAATKSRTLVKS